jgi:CHAT domain-containing protein
MRGLFRSGPGGAPMADAAMLKRLPPLPGTRVELTAMAAALKAPAGAVRLDIAATEAAVHADKSLSQARVVAFATHGLLPDEIRGLAEPGLVLTPPDVPSLNDDGVLTASEAAALELTAEWVVLSACNTATADSSADSLSSLSRAFLYAGARALLASHWRVSDEATAVLTVETQREDAVQTRAAALQAAMRAVRSGKRSDGSAVAGWTPDWAHPMMWAPFSLISTADE